MPSQRSNCRYSGEGGIIAEMGVRFLSSASFRAPRVFLEVLFPYPYLYLINLTLIWPVSSIPRMTSRTCTYRNRSQGYQPRLLFQYLQGSTMYNSRTDTSSEERGHIYSRPSYNSLQCNRIQSTHDAHMITLHHKASLLCVAAISDYNNQIHLTAKTQATQLLG